jgi:uncharacterized metal-binding protein
MKCWHQEKEEKFPKGCTRLLYKDLIEDTIEESYTDPVAIKMNIACENLLIRGYDERRGPQWSRIEELIYFMHDMDYKKIGIAFCTGLSQEAKVLHMILEENGFEVVSVNCMAGAVAKKELKRRYSITPSKKTGPYACNPLMQAKVLNLEKTEFNIMFGLCLGHDSLFIRYSEADITPLVVKDRVLAHNPIGALYMADGYYRRKFHKASRPQ